MTNVTTQDTKKSRKKVNPPPSVAEASKMRFLKLVKQIALENYFPGLRFKGSALKVLEEAIEAYFIQFLQEKHSVFEIDSVTKENKIDLIIGKLNDFTINRLAGFENMVWSGLNKGKIHGMKEIPNDSILARKYKIKPITTGLMKTNNLILSSYFYHRLHFSN